MGNFQELTLDHQKIINDYLSSNKLPKETPHLVDFDNNIFISKKENLVNEFSKVSHF